MKSFQSFLKESPSDIRVGRRFLHKRYLKAEPGKPMREWEPDTGTITKVQQGVVYYKLEGESKALSKVDIDKFEAMCVKAWL